MSRDSQEIDRIASEWLILRDSDHWSDEDAAHLDEWLKTSTVHRVAFLRLELGWEETRRLKALSAGATSTNVPPPGQWNLSPIFEAPAVIDGRSGVPTPRRRVRLWALAASVVIACAIGWFVLPAGDPYTTPVGGLASVPMIDGSKVTLNTNSRVRVVMTSAERRIVLQQGEAFFEVAKDPKRPFVVVADGHRLVAVGTQFSVRRDTNAVQVVVTEGKVRAEADVVAAKPLLLTPGSVARFGADGVLVQRETVPEVETQLTWRSGLLTFRNATLAEAISEFNRYSVRKVVIADPDIGTLKIEGNFRSTSVPAFLELLQAGFPVRVTDEGDQIILSSK